MLKEKIKKVGMIVLCVTLFLSAMSLTLSLIPKDKTTSAPAPKPIYSKSFSFYEHFYSYDLDGDMLYLVKGESLTDDTIALEYNSTGSDPGLSFFFRFNQDEIPESGSKLVMEFDYTMEKQVFKTAGMIFQDCPYGFDDYRPLPTGNHSVRIVYDGLDPNLHNEEEVYPQYDFTVYVDNSEFFHHNGSLPGPAFGTNYIQGFGLYEFNDEIECSDGEIVFTLHSLSLKVY